MAIFVQVATTRELSPGHGKLVEVNQKRIALFNMGGQFYAIDDMCPHRGASLSEGELDGETVVCPWHGALFELRTGAVTRPPAAIGVMTYETRVQGEAIEIAI
jgi:3-phenylpropionate/trans-cinnamate dioxygenase ferredoxin subunit